MNIVRDIKKGIAVIITVTLLVGCAGRAANPVMVQQYGDDSKSCSRLENEMMFVEGEITRLVPQTEKTGKNVALGVTGFFFIVPLFFMDLSQAEQQEVNAFRQRYNHLLLIARDKSCGVEAEEIPAFDKPISTKTESGEGQP